MNKFVFSMFQFTLFAILFVDPVPEVPQPFKKNLLEKYTANGFVKLLKIYIWILYISSLNFNVLKLSFMSYKYFEYIILSHWVSTFDRIPGYVNILDVTPVLLVLFISNYMIWIDPLF